jgi:hypothetical protein
MSLGNCNVDGQGAALPASQTCDLTALHMNAAVIDTPSAEEIYSGRMVNPGRLDWEFYAIDPNTGTAPEKTDLYDNFYQFAGMGIFDQDFTGNAYNKSFLPMASTEMPTPVTPPPMPPVSTVFVEDERVKRPENEFYLLLGVLALAFYLGNK